MAGLLVPKAATELVTALKAGSSLPIEMHTHYTSGCASMTYMKAVEAGADILDCAISPFALGTSQPATEVMVEAFRGTEYDTGLDLNKLAEIADYFRPIREKYLENGLMNPKNMGVNIKTLQYQVPGGMLSNLTSQLASQHAEDKFYDVLEEVPRVRTATASPQSRSIRRSRNRSSAMRHRSPAVRQISLLRSSKSTRRISLLTSSRTRTFSHMRCSRP